MPSIQLKICSPVAPSNTALVARALRPLPLFANRRFAIAVHCSTKIGSVLSPSGASTPLAFSFSAADAHLGEVGGRLLGIEAGRA